MQNAKNTNGSIWQNLAAFGKNILAHVNISYDGAKGSLHIEIVPAEPKSVVDGEAKMVESNDDPKQLLDQSSPGTKPVQVDQAEAPAQKPADATNSNP